MALGLADGLLFLVVLGCPAAAIVGMGPVQGGMKLDTSPGIPFCALAL